MSTVVHKPDRRLDEPKEVLLGFLDYYRSVIGRKIEGLTDAELRESRLPSGWTPLELANHLRYVELRWLEWGFEGRHVGELWADADGDRWAVGPDETLTGLLADLAAQAARSRAIIESHDLADVGQPGDRWDGADPATLERVLFHLLQEYARHVGHLDIVTELATGLSEELRPFCRTARGITRRRTPARGSPGRPPGAPL